MFDKYNAKPIWAKEYTANDYFIFEQKFDVTENVKTTLYISCDTEYACFVNGVFVSCGQYGGIKNERYYSETDISQYVKNGENTLSATVYYQGKSCASRTSYTPYLTFAVTNGKNVCVSDKNTKCRYDLRYKNGEIEKISPQIGYTFHFDATGEIPPVETDVLNTDYVFLPEPVKHCNVKPAKNGEIIAQGFFSPCDTYDTAAKNLQYAYLRAAEPSDIFETDKYGPFELSDEIKFKNGCGDIYAVFDLKKETAGYFDMDITAKEGTELYISYGEQLEDLRVRAYTGGRNFAFTYKCSGGRQQFTHYTRRIAGRYIQLHVKNPQDFKIHAFGIKSCEYPFVEKAGYKGDKLLEKIYNTSVDTLKLCMHEHYEDCPWREQAMYMMDSRIQMLCGYYAFENTEPQKAALVTFMKSADENGILPLTAPADKVNFTIPAFVLMWVVAYEDYLEHTGNVDDIAAMAEFAGKIINLFRNMYDGKGIAVPKTPLYWNFYDWADGLDNSPWGTLREDRGYDAPIMLYYITALQSYAKILDKLSENTADVKKETEMMKQKVNDLFWDTEKQMYKTYSNIPEHFCELTQSLAICTGTATDADGLKEKLKNGLCGVKATLSMMFFKYEALSSDENRITDNIAEIWGKMLFCGATSFWETQKGAYDFENAGSMCHGWSALPIYFLKKCRKPSR